MWNGFFYLTYSYIFLIFRFMSRFTELDSKHDNTIVNFFPLKDELYSATETNFIHRIDPETLDTLEQVAKHVPYIQHVSVM